MDFYQKKYLKYKNKYLGLLNQQVGGRYTIEQKGGRHTIDQISITKDGFIFDYDTNKFIEDPITFNNIPADRAVLINNTIYDLFTIFKTIITQKIAKDPINMEIISDDDLDLMYSIARRNNAENLFDKDDRYQPLLNATMEAYYIEKNKIINLIKEKLLQMTNLKKIDLKNIDLKGLNNLLDTKKDLLNSLDPTIKDDILSKPFNFMFKILLLTKTEIDKLYSYDSNNIGNILNLTINQINKFLKYDSDIQEYIFNIQEYINSEPYFFDYTIIDKFLQLSQDELKLLKKNFPTLEDINKIYGLSFDEIKKISNLSLDEIKILLDSKLGDY